LRDRLALGAGMGWKSLETLDYGTLKQMLSGFAQSPAGRLEVLGLAPRAHRAEIIRELEISQECLRMLQEGHVPDFSGLNDYSILFQQLTVAELALEPRQILEILGLVLCVETVRKSLGSLVEEVPRVGGLAKGLPELSRLLFVLNGKITPNGEIEDNASPQLKKIRNEINILRNRLYHALGRILQRHSFSQTIQDDVITLRNERYVIPVRVESRKEMTGVVHGTSSSGATLFVEPLETLELNNELVRLKERADEEVRNILRRLTEQIRDHLEDLRAALSVLAYLDFGFAKARFCRDYRCVAPEINDEGVLSIVDGRHPILESTLRTQRREVVPISAHLDAQRQILVISGPNTGGKTVALKTLGLLALMAISGMPVPAASANVCVVREVMADIGDRQSIAENLSTFSSHLVNIREILETVSPPALVLLDELGTGTDPAEGSALGIAIVERLRQKGAMAVVTTHHNGLKMYASSTERVANASVEFDEASLRPTYRLIHGLPGNSSGLEIANKLGLDEGLIEDARQRVSAEEQQIARFSRQLREQIEQQTKLQARLQAELRGLQARSRELEDKAQREEVRRERELDQARKQAFEAFEKESRRLLGEVRDRYLSIRAKRELEKKGAQLREAVNLELASAREAGASHELPQAFAGSTHQLLVAGSRVRVKRFGREGTILAAHGEGQWEVAVGNFKCVVDTRELEPTSAPAPVEQKPLAAARITVQMNSPELQSNEINVVGCTVDEALLRVGKFLDTAFLASLSQVRLVHGTGMGILRRALSDWLSTQPYVDKFHAAETSQGGNGVTVVYLKA